MITLTDANSGTKVLLAPAAITSVREFPAGQCEVSTTDPSFPVIQVSESVEHVQRLIQSAIESTT